MVYFAPLEEDMKHQFDEKFDPMDDDVQIALDRRRKLADGDVRMILRMRDSGRSKASIARVFGVNRSTIYRICNGLTQLSVTRPSSQTGTKRRCLTEAQVQEIRELLEIETPVKAIAHKFNVTDVTINNIASGKTWQ